MNSSGRIFDVHAAQNAFHFFSVISLLTSNIFKVCDKSLNRPFIFFYCFPFFPGHRLSFVTLKVSFRNLDLVLDKVLSDSATNYLTYCSLGCALIGRLKSTSDTSSFHSLSTYSDKLIAEEFFLAATLLEEESNE